MRNIPVYVQKPNKPPGELVGAAPDNWTAEDVAEYVGVPKGCFIAGRILTRRRTAKTPRVAGRFWSLVANVGFKRRF